MKLLFLRKLLCPSQKRKPQALEGRFRSRTLTSPLGLQTVHVLRLEFPKQGLDRARDSRTSSAKSMGESSPGEMELFLREASGFFFSKKQSVFSALSFFFPMTLTAQPLGNQRSL